MGAGWRETTHGKRKIRMPPSRAGTWWPRATRGLAIGSVGRAMQAPSPPPSHIGAVTRVVYPQGPPACADNSTATRAYHPGRPQRRAVLSKPWDTSSHRTQPLWAVGPA